MARQALDPTLNEDLGRQVAKLQEMLIELYAASSTTPDPSVTTLTASGAITSGAGVTGATVTSTGLATVGSITLDTGTKTAAATAGAATLNKQSGVITSEALTTAAGEAYTLTITDSVIGATDLVLATVANGTNTQGWLHLERVTPGSGSVVIVVRNIHASEALNGTIKVTFAVLQN